jgi:hypothetical protein
MHRREMSNTSAQDDRPLGRAGARASSEGVLALSEEHCWGYLHIHQLGRLAIVIGGRLQIFPVNHAVGEKAIVFRTESGSKLARGPGSTMLFRNTTLNSPSAAIYTGSRSNADPAIEALRRRLAAGLITPAKAFTASRPSPILNSQPRSDAR